MPPRKFVRRRDIIIDESSPVSNYEQARLLNDPDVSFENSHHESTRRTIDDNAGQLRQSRPANPVSNLLKELEKAA